MIIIPNWKQRRKSIYHFKESKPTKYKKVIQMEPKEEHEKEKMDLDLLQYKEAQTEESVLG